MTHFSIRAAMIGLAAGALGACATSQYPTAEGQAKREPLTMPTPNFPITTPETATAEPAPAAAPSGGTVQSQALPPPAPAVTSQPLAPIAAPPAPVTTTKTIIVAGGRVVDAEGRPQTYEVQPGEGLDAIARKLGATRAQLADDNGLSAPYRLTPGQTLKGPAAKTKAYLVQSGDTLFAIARRFGVRPQDIALANEFEMSAPIRPGQRLLLPAGFRDSGPSTRTVTLTEPRAVPPPQVPVHTPPAVTTLAATVTPPPAPAPPPPPPPPAPVAPVAPKPYTPLVTAAPITPKPYTPPVVAKPYTPPATTAPAIIQSNVPPTDNEVAAAGAGRFVWPVQGAVITPFGPKGGGQRNDGLDIRATAGTTIRAAAAGEVVYAGDQVPGFGNLVLVKHDGGWVTAYAHMGRVDVKMRDTVAQGQQLGQVGSTGGVAEPQLHFEVRYAPSPKDKARPVNPALVLPG